MGSPGGYDLVTRQFPDIYMSALGKDTGSSYYTDKKFTTLTSLFNKICPDDFGIHMLSGLGTHVQYIQQFILYTHTHFFILNLMANFYQGIPCMSALFSYVNIYHTHIPKENR